MWEWKKKLCKLNWFLSQRMFNFENFDAARHLLKTLMLPDISVMISSLFCSSLLVYSRDLPLFYSNAILFIRSFIIHFFDSFVLLFDEESDSRESIIEPFHNRSATYWSLSAFIFYYNGPDKSLARTGRKQANVSVRMAWISFGALPSRGEKTWWQLASRCCWNRARPWHASELVSFLVGLRTYQHPVITLQTDND